MTTNLPRSIVPRDGLPKSRIGREWQTTKEPISGHPPGLPNLNGRVILTDLFEHVVLCADGRIVIVHAEGFIRTDRAEKPMYHHLEVSQRTRCREQEQRKSRGNQPPRTINLDEYV